MEKEWIKEYFGLSDVGPKRLNNEDVFATLQEYGFFALADGMGGHRAGEIAAKEAISYICTSIKQVMIQSYPQVNLNQLSFNLKKLFENANDWIYRLSRSDESLFGMGTTLCSLLFLEEKVLFSHVGDSRIYCYREKELYLMTKDHSAFVYSKHKNHRLKKILTQVIGTPKVID
ncbi:MAG: serine/threonine-protein phosphatase, partial [Chlamydiae bacterium]|nr:serine/threonine-protein phosphatase [Chlamydiota bacterium]